MDGGRGSCILVKLACLNHGHLLNEVHVHPVGWDGVCCLGNSHHGLACCTLYPLL